MTKTENRDRIVSNLSVMGFAFSEIQSLIKIERTLHRWDEAQCGDGNDHASWCLEQDEESKKWFRVTYPHQGKSYHCRVPDREAGAKRRLAAIMADHPEFEAYHQGDCRGCALYIIRKSDLAGQDIGSVYNRGLAVSV